MSKDKNKGKSNSKVFNKPSEKLLAFARELQARKDQKIKKLEQFAQSS